MQRWLALAALAVLAACGGGGGGGGTSASVPSVTVTPTPVPYTGPSPVSASTTLPSGMWMQNFPSVAGYGGSIAAGVMQGVGGTITATVSLGPLPAVPGQSTPTLYTNAPNAVLVYADFIVSNVATVSVTQPTLTFTFPSGTLVNTPYYYAFWAGNANPVWADADSGNRYPVTTSSIPTETITIAGAPSVSLPEPFVYGFVIYR